MKKLIISAICLLALAAGVSSYAYYRSHQIVAKNSLAKANVEALTDNEYINVLTCYSTYRVSTSNPDGESVWKIVACDGCKSVYAFEFRDSGLCTQNNGGTYVK